MAENIFADEWMECLEAHYMHVIRINDKVTEPSLSIVMRSAGFSDAQLAELRVRATMHIDDVSADFVPDLDVLETHDHQHNAPEAVEAHIYNIPIEVEPAPTEAALPVEAEAVSQNDIPAEVELESETLEEETLTEQEPEQEDPDEPQQLSLF
jgi:uncharacterized protein